MKRKLLIVFSAIALFFVAFKLIMMTFSLKHDNSANEAYAKKDLLDLLFAIKSYHEQYDKFPVISSSTADGVELITKDFVSILDGSDIIANPRGKQFIDNSHPIFERGLVDPWGNQYQTIFDFDGDGYVKYKDTEYEAKVIIISLGADGAISEDDLFMK